MRLPGIGETLANRIIEKRPYARLTDLLEVEGIGPATYRRLKPFYARGRFFGIDGQTHVHTDPDGDQRAVVNCFNLDDDPVTREIVFRPADLELDPAAAFAFAGAEFTRDGDAYRGSVTRTTEAPSSAYSPLMN